MFVCVYSKQSAATARSPEEEEVHTLGVVVEDFELALATDVEEEEKKSETEDG